MCPSYFRLLIYSWQVMQMRSHETCSTFLEGELQNTSISDTEKRRESQASTTACRVQQTLQLYIAFYISRQIWRQNTDGKLTERNLFSCWNYTWCHVLSRSEKIFLLFFILLSFDIASYVITWKCIILPKRVKLSLPRTGLKNKMTPKLAPFHGKMKPRSIQQPCLLWIALFHT